jgi:hypothetical protein
LADQRHLRKPEARPGPLIAWMSPIAMEEALPKVLFRLMTMRKARVWPNGSRYLFTDAFGVVVLASLYRRLREPTLLAEAEQVVNEVDRVLGRERGYLVGEEAAHEGQSFHYTALWAFALSRLGKFLPEYRSRALAIAKDAHARFVKPGIGVRWKMTADSKSTYPGVGIGGVDPFFGYVLYRTFAERELAREIDDMKDLVEATYQHVRPRHDMAAGLMLWLCHFFPDEEWAVHQRRAALTALENVWVDVPNAKCGYFCREPETPDATFAFANYGISLGLQSIGARWDRVDKLHRFFSRYQAGNACDWNAITHVMACAAMAPGDLLAERVFEASAA